MTKLSHTWNPQKVIDTLDKALTTRPEAERPDLNALLGKLRGKKATLPKQVTSPQTLGNAGEVAPENVAKTRVKKEVAS